MRKIIDGKSYDTGTAAEVGHMSYGSTSDFRYFEETLYKKRTGEYFLYGYGHAMSHYAKQLEQNSWGAGEKIVPLTYEAAQRWAEENLDADGYEAEFGPADEGGENVQIGVRVSPAAKAALDAECSRTGETRSAIIERLLLGLAR